MHGCLALIGSPQQHARPGLGAQKKWWVSGEGATAIALVDFFLRFIGHFIVHIKF